MENLSSGEKMRQLADEFYLRRQKVWSDVIDIGQIEVFKKKDMLKKTIILHPVDDYDDKAVKMLKVKAMQEEIRQLWFAVFAQKGSYLDVRFDLAHDSLSKKTPFANRKLLLEEITNNERNEMEEGQMDEIEIIEWHEDVEEEQDNKAKETPIAKRKLLLEKKNEMEEGQMEENEIKEGHEDVGEKQDKKPWIFPNMRIDRAERSCLMKAIIEEIGQLNLVFAVSAQKVCSDVIDRRHIIVLKTKVRGVRIDRYKADRSLLYFQSEVSPPSRYGILESIERKKAYVEMEIRRLEIERFSKHALEEDMNITRILKSGSMDGPYVIIFDIGHIDVFKKKKTSIKEDFIKSILGFKSHVLSEHMDTRYDNSETSQRIRLQSHVSSEHMDTRYDNSETSQRIRLQVFRLQRMMDWILPNFHSLTFPTWTIWKEYQESVMNILPFEEKMKVRRFLFRGGQSRRKLFFRKGRNKREQWESEKERKYLGIWGGNAITQHAAPQQSGKLIDIIQNQGGLDVTEKGEGKRAIFADCHLESRPGQAFNPFELHAECRPKCPFVVNVKKRNAGQTNDVASKTFPVCKPGEDIFKRNAITQHAAPQQSGKLIDIIEDHGGFDVTEKGGGNRTVYADCHLEYRLDQADNLIELHAALRPECPFVENMKKWNAGQTNDVATQTVPVREQGEDIFRGNAITQHAAPQQSGKLIDITEDQCEFDDTEKEIQEMDELLRCKVCLDNVACIVFLPCRHMATCEYCEGFLNHCPVCRSFIEEAVKINEE